MKWPSVIANCSSGKQRTEDFALIQDCLRGGLRDGDQKRKLFYAKITTQRCVTIGGLTELRGFHPVRHTPIGPETSALPKTPRHTASITSQPTIACPSRVIKNPFNMWVKGEVGDAKCLKKVRWIFFNRARNS